VGGLEGHT